MSNQELIVFLQHWQEIVKKNLTQPYFPSYNSFFQNKCNAIDSIQKLERKLLSWKSILKVHSIDPTGMKVLVAGCGSGFECIFLSLLGAKEITALEIVPMFIDGINRYLRDLNLDLRIKPLLHDIHTLEHCGEYNLVLTVDAISHMYNYRLFLSKCLSLLKKKGCLLIIDDNNKINFRRRKELTNIWNTWETKGRIIENGRGGYDYYNSYELDRYEYIAREFPVIAESIAKQLAKETAGMRQNEMKNAVIEFQETTKMPGKLYRRGMMAYDSKYDMPKELPFNPYVLKSELLQCGYIKVKHRPEIVTMISLLRTLFVGMLIFFKPFVYLFYSKGFSISAIKGTAQHRLTGG